MHLKKKRVGILLKFEENAIRRSLETLSPYFDRNDITPFLSNKIPRQKLEENHKLIVLESLQHFKMIL